MLTLGTVWSGARLSTRYEVTELNVDLNQGCSKISSPFNRCNGSCRIIERIRHFALDDNESGIMKWPLLIFEKSTVGSMS